MFTQVSDILEKYVKAGDTLVTGVSGGPDSMCLLDILTQFSKKMPCRVVVVHVNHGLRAKDSDKDEAFVQKAAEKNGFTLESKKIRLGGTSRLEVRGREERRNFFESLQKKYGAKWILTAHHADDHIESMVLHFLRGAGPAGLSGIEIAKDHYLRPFLTISKKEILKYCRQNHIRFRIDQTNKNVQFSRNLLRNKIFPLFRKMNPRFEKTLAQNAEIFRSLQNFLDIKTHEFLDSTTFRSKDFLKLPEIIQYTVIQKMFQKFSKDPYRLPIRHVQAVVSMIEKNVGKKIISLGKKGAFYLDKGLISFKN